MNFGETIKFLRKEKKWTQAKLAEEAGTTIRVVSYYENAKDNSMPNQELLLKFAQAFNMLLPDLLSFEKETMYKGSITIPSQEGTPSEEDEKVTFDENIRNLENYIALYAEKNPEDWKAAEIVASMKNDLFSLSDLGDIEKFQMFKRFGFANTAGNAIPFQEHTLYAAISEFVWKDRSIEREEIEYIDSLLIYEIFEKVKTYIEFEVFSVNQKRKKEMEEKRKKTAAKISE